MNALAELAQIDPGWIWDQHLSDAEYFLSAYEKQMGMRPPQKLSMEQVQDAVRVPIGALSVATEAQSAAANGEPKIEI